jgi:hypothetical protein
VAQQGERGGGLTLALVRGGGDDLDRDPAFEVGAGGLCGVAQRQRAGRGHDGQPDHDRDDPGHRARQARLGQERGFAAAAKGPAQRAFECAGQRVDQAFHGRLFMEGLPHR